MSLQRLKIRVYKWVTGRKQPRPSSVEMEQGDKGLELQVNPETFSISAGSQFSEKNRKGSPGSVDHLWEKNSARKLTFEFILDNTGAIPSADILNVSERIKKINDILYKVQGSTHEPNYLHISWGTLNFWCRLESMNITYKLFTPEGEPLRASINASFIEVEKEEEVNKSTKKSSPDVTHALTVKGEESLPMMAEKVYGSSSYYIAVAQANKLIHFRNIKAGDTIVFPPIKDQHA